MSKNSDYNEYQNFMFHPYNVMLTLILFGICVLFLSLSIAFVYTRIQNNLPAIRLPNLFIFNTLVLIGSSYTMKRATESYKKDETQAYQMSILFTIVLSFVFMVLQYFAWRSLFSQNIFIHSDNSASYLYVISGLHFAHVIAGLPFLVAFWNTAKKRMKEPVSVLVYFSDPEKRLKLRLLTIYWHFLDALWVYLVLFFWINHIIK